MSSKRVTATDRVRAEIDGLFADPEREHGEVLEEVARLSERVPCLSNGLSPATASMATVSADGVRVPDASQLEAAHGSTRSRPSPVKSDVLRVASVVPRAMQIAAIIPSSTASGRPAPRRDSCNRA